MATTLSTGLTDLLPSIIAEASFQAQERSIMRNLVKNYAISAGTGKTVNVPTWANETATTLTEGTALTADTLSTTSATLTVAEVGVMATVTDLAMRTSSANVIADAGTILGSAVATKMDKDLLGLFAGFTTVVGNGVINASAAHVFEAIARLRKQGVSGNDIVCVVHPYIAYDLKSGVSNAFAGTASDTSNEAMRTGYIGTLAGVAIYESANVTDASGVSVGAVFHKDALGLAMLNDISIEPSRDAALRGTSLICTATYGFGELTDLYGVGMNFDSSLTIA